MGTKYADDGEEAQHETAIESLANETHRPVSEIRPPYDRAFHACRTARVRDCLSVCATRRTRKALLGSRS
jgi:hypothetical protein